ncbi:hypothetical protein SETIT_9G302700v2 [Setaria italica]|uniref:DNA helicase Pif1-like 2B domain-containing protein n=1 Tax=Setaria italica TaxID=4555 RepID=K4AMA7_SETIT|nr:hypothetical protein SETIT_9G302700v2 [Setaria italica]
MLLDPELIWAVPPNTCLKDPNYITSRAILSTRNDCERRWSISFGSVEDDPHNYYPSEFLNTLTPNGLPPHMLKLKINCPIILPRNIDPANGLCNGTRFVVRGLQKNAIDAEIVLGQYYGTRRKQFPFRLSFTITINKAHRQTIPNVGIYLPKPVFSHGQLYVAPSRETAAKNIKILTAEKDDDEEDQKQDNKVETSEKNKKKQKRKSKSNMSDKKKVNKKDTTDTYTNNIMYSEVLTK